jgi:hypothetical protein
MFDEHRRPERYMVVVRLSDKEEPLSTRIREHVPLIMEILTRLSSRDDRPVRAFSSPTGEWFGCLLSTQWDARGIRSQIESPGSNNPRSKEDVLPSPLQRFDEVMVVELGNDFATGRGFDAMNAWFLRPTRSPESLFKSKEPDPRVLQSRLALVKTMIDEQVESDRELLIKIGEVLDWPL